MPDPLQSQDFASAQQVRHDKEKGMKVILAMVQSLNGKITKEDENDIHSWTSQEDQDYFYSLIQQNTLIVMGSGTYTAVHPKPQAERLRVVLTRNPQKYKQEEIPNQLEFTEKSPKDLIQDLEKRGYSQMLLVGGSAINTLFFKESLIDELWLTLEPRIFGKGKSIVGLENLDVSLELLKMEELNSIGTLLLKYKVNSQVS